MFSFLMDEWETLVQKSAVSIASVSRMVSSWVPEEKEASAPKPTIQMYKTKRKPIFNILPAKQPSAKKVKQEVAEDEEEQAPKASSKKKRKGDLLSSYLNKK